MEPRNLLMALYDLLLSFMYECFMYIAAGLRASRYNHQPVVKTKNYTVTNSDSLLDLLVVMVIPPLRSGAALIPTACKTQNHTHT